MTRGQRYGGMRTRMPPSHSPPIRRYDAGFAAALSIRVTTAPDS